MLAVEVISNSGSWIRWASSKPVTEEVTRQGATWWDTCPPVAHRRETQAPRTCWREWLWDFVSVSFPLWPAGGAVTTEGPERQLPRTGEGYMGVHA